MAKIDFISSLAKETTREIVRNGEEWRRYLNTAARLYKYPFQEQVLIYAQRPDATACASIEIWNDIMKCWVNKGAKGIALIDEDASRPRLRYVFDVSDVHKARRIGRDPYLWEMRVEHEEAVIRRLEKTYGVTNPELSFVGRLLEIAGRITLDTYEETAEDMKYLAEGSFLEDLDEYSRKVHLRDTLQASISYTLLTRCGLDAEEYIEDLNFEYIHEFNTLPVVSQLGTNTAELCKPVLMEIGKAIRAYDREISKKGLANVNELRYNTLKHESKEGEEETKTDVSQKEPSIDGKKQEEEKDEHGIDVSKERRLLHPEYPDGRTATGNPYQIRADEEGIPEGTQEGNLFRDAAGGQTDEPPAGDPGNSRGEDGASHEPDGENRGRERGTEGERPDALGKTDEQHPARSGGDNPGRTDLQLNTGAKEESDSQELPDFFAFLEGQGEESSENILRGLLCFDDYLKKKRKDIAAYFVTEPDAGKRTSFIKKAYNKEFSELSVGTHCVGYKAKEDGLAIWAGNYLTRSCEAQLSWDLVRELIDAYLAENIYLMPGETIDLPEFGTEKGTYQQLSLFPGMDEQIGNIAIDQADERLELSAGDLISDEMIDHALLTGGGQKNTRARIFAKYQKGLDPDTMEEFLRREYGTGGKGFTFEGEPLCIWYDENGMNFSRGMAARYEPVRTLSWSQVEQRTFHLIDAGNYMDEAEMWHVPMQEKQELASKIYFFFRDEYGTMPPEVASKIYGYPEAEKEIMEHLSAPEGIEQILAQMDKATEQIKNEEVTPGFRLIYKPEDIRQSVEQLKREPIRFPSATDLEIPVESFITQDEIDYKLSRGSNVSGGLFRIYDFFLQGHEKKELADFLKQEYGTGGSSPALAGAWPSHEDHDSKGIQLSKGSILEPSAKVLLTWPKVAQRIQKLIDTGRFLTPQAKEQYAQWKAKREQEALETARQELQKGTEETQPQEPPLPIQEEQRPSAAIENAGQPEDSEVLLEPDLEVPEDRMVQEVETDVSLAVNYRITDDTLTMGSPQEKFDRNIAAIQTLRRIESEERAATPDEQEVLAGYVGWGGLAEAFDEQNSAWHDRYLMVKGLLDEREYRAARESTLTAHYTSPVVIRSIYEALGNMGFEKGNVLEPSMGTGNFFGMLPETMRESRLYGVELDSLTGRIAKQLYPKARIQITGFEKTDYPDDFFDVAVGNVPFGNYKVFDRKYDKYNLLIHDYFFAKSIDKVRQGGVVAMITSNGISGGTFDKRDSRARRYIAKRCDLLGAIRLPRGTFEDADLTTDILFFQKRERQRDLINEEPGWVQTTVVHESDFTNPDGEVVKNRLYTNNYFLEHPEMVLGRQEVIAGPFGPQLVCSPTGESLEGQLKEAIRHIQGSIESVGLDELEDELEKAAIPADPDVKNYSYTVVKGDVYYREDSVMKPVEMSDSMRERIKGMVAIRDATNEVINYQLEEYEEASIKEKQAGLSNLYDAFTKRFGLISSQTNKRAFNQDSSYCLLCSLEILNEDGTLKRKADMFTKRTIKRQAVITSVDTPTEALAVSMSEKACVDIGYMSTLLGGSENYDRIVAELSGVIFKNPLSDLDDPYAGWETGDEYLSGNVREKLEIARLCAQNHPEYAVNVTALERVQPKMLDASEIEVRLGATWVEPRYINDFMEEVFETPVGKLNQGIIGTQYSKISGQWNIKGKSADFGNPLTEAAYGTGRANAYKILEDSLNLRDSRIYDTVIEDGKEKRVLNKKETMLVSQKQEAIREAYKDWIFQDGERREVLCKKYNELFNSNRPREYDGSHLTFPGMSPNISMRPHQKNAVAHQLYGNNTLLAHCVGAGKTFEMAAAAVECKRLGLAQKSLFVVPNHLTGQWASEFLTLYPGANILAATKKDFEPANRRKFCSRIATGDYDAVIIGHSQFEKIPLSKERQAAMIERQISEITLEIESLKASQGERYTIKQMEKTKKTLLVRLERLNDTSRKDDVVTFEQLGVDRLFVDESHGYKNLFLYTKMRNVAGIAQTEAQKSSDMFAKCQYMDELTGGKGITFATGTPISNSMTELYTNMRYLQYGTLQRLGLGHFDSWAASFGETITAIELAPEGTGYRAKTRFAKFFNLPELISIFKEAADIQTPDMLKLPVPEAVHENVVLKPSEYQQDMVKSLADRAETIRNGRVDAAVDNMLKVTNDGRKLALDQRLINSLLPDETGSKTGACVERAVKLWSDTAEKKSAQLIFCDLSTPKNDGTFNVYQDIREKLVAKGVPPEEIAFIHDANTEVRKTELFAKVRSGQVRFLLGSTAKMGAGTNVQDRLIAEHHLDVPWRPSDIEQREGRIVRQGNQNEKVHIFRYVTEGTFDSYSWQLIENKQKFISQIMTSKSPVRSCEDIDEASLSYAEVKALATGNPYIKEKMDLDIQVSKLRLLKANHTSQIYRMEDNIAKHYPKKIGLSKERIAAYQMDVGHYREVKPVDKDVFAMKLGERSYTDKKEAGTALIAYCRQVKTPGVAVPIGEYLGYKMSVEYDTFYHKFTLNLKGALTHSIEVGADALGNLTRINNALDAMEGKLRQEQEALANTEKQLANAKEEVTKPFPQEMELEEKLERLNELNALLNMDEKGSSDCMEEPEEIPDAECMASEKRPSILDKLEIFKEQSSKAVPEPMKTKEKAEQFRRSSL